MPETPSICAMVDGYQCIGVAYCTATYVLAEQFERGSGVVNLIVV